MVYSKRHMSFLVVAVFSIAQGALAVGLPDEPNTHTGKFVGPAEDITDALMHGKADLLFRMRYENVTDDIPSTATLAGTDDANLTTLRTVLGYTTARWNGLFSRIEFEAVSNVSDPDNAFTAGSDLTFPPGPDGSRIAVGHALIPDPADEDINEAYIGWRSPSSGCRNAPGGCNGPTTIKVGRQTITYDNHRWVGNIVWRQNNQSYDAIRIDNTSINDLSISYAFITRVHRLFGQSSPFDLWDMENSHLINIAYQTPVGKAVLYSYMLNFKDNPKTPFPEGVGAVGTPGSQIFDSDTTGIRFTGKYETSDAFALLYELEFANQDPNHDAGPTLSDNNYSNIEFGGEFKLAGKPTEVRVGREVLEGNGVNAVQTNFATVHAFNGWADKFAGAPAGSATPPDGLEDTSLTFVMKGLIGPSKLEFQYHNYSANNTSQDYGKEYGLLLAKPFSPNWLAAIKYANFKDGGDGFSVDTQKLWLFAQFKFSQ